MAGRQANEIFSDEGWDEWPDLDLLEDDPEVDLDFDDEREPA